MPHDILNSMRSLREDMRQRLLQVPEYRALVALDRSIDEICAILQDPVNAPQPQPETQQPQAARAPTKLTPNLIPMAAIAASEPPHPAPARHQAIATAFAETLAAKLDQRNGGRAAAPFAPAGHT